LDSASQAALALSTVIVMSFVVVGVRPDGVVGLRLTCTTRERADLFANMCRIQHPDWSVQIRPSSGLSGTFDVVPDADRPTS
jgi:hypothetical protein